MSAACTRCGGDHTLSQCPWPLIDEIAAGADPQLAERARAIMVAARGPVTMRRCPKCSAPRADKTCHKCGGPTFVPPAAWVDPALPPIETIRKLARQVGYAIGVHGTLERDLDLIAAPWSSTAIPAANLIEHLAAGLGARIVDTEEEPLGRFAATIQMNGWFKLIDISVCPVSLSSTQPEPEDASFLAWVKKHRWCWIRDWRRRALQTA